MSEMESVETAIGTPVQSGLEDSAESVANGNGDPHLLPVEPATDAPTDDTEGGAEPAAPAEPTPEQKQLQQRFKMIEAAKREQLKNAQLQRQIQQQHQQLTYHSQQMKFREEQLSAREAQIAKLERAMQTKDIEALGELGFNYIDFTKHHLEKTTPEYQIKLLQQKLEQQEQQRAEELRRYQQSQQAESQIAEIRTIAQNVVNIVDNIAEEVPELYEWPPERIMQEAVTVRDEIIRRHQRVPTYNEVIEILAADAKREAGIRSERVAKRKTPSSSENKSGNGQQAGRPGAPTLTNASTGTRAAPPRQRTEAELDEELKAQLRSVFNRKR